MIQPGIIRIDNEIYLIVNDNKYLNLSKYYIQEDTKGESIIKKNHAAVSAAYTYAP